MSDGITDMMRERNRVTALASGGSRDEVMEVCDQLEAELAQELEKTTWRTEDPTEPGRYLVTWRNLMEEVNYGLVHWAGRWYFEWSDKTQHNLVDDRVLAWMPLPELWTEEVR